MTWKNIQYKIYKSEAVQKTALFSDTILDGIGHGPGSKLCVGLVEKSKLETDQKLFAERINPRNKVDSMSNQRSKMDSMVESNVSSNSF